MSAVAPEVRPPGPGPTAAPKAQRSAPDRWARRLLRLDEGRATPDVHNIFSSSIMLSAGRCLLSYIVLPAFPAAVNAIPLIGPFIGIPLGVLALVFDVKAIRRFFRADHRWRWVAAGLYVTIMVMVSALVVRDFSRLG